MAFPNRPRRSPVPDLTAVGLDRYAALLLVRQVRKDIQRVDSAPDLTADQIRLGHLGIASDLLRLHLVDGSLVHQRMATSLGPASPQMPFPVGRFDDAVLKHMNEHAKRLSKRGDFDVATYIHHQAARYSYNAGNFGEATSSYSQLRRLYQREAGVVKRSGDEDKAKELLGQADDCLVARDNCAWLNQTVTRELGPPPLIGSVPLPKESAVPVQMRVVPTLTRSPALG